MKAMIQKGQVYHSRLVPNPYAFTHTLPVAVLLLDGSESDINKSIKESGLQGRFQRKDYFGDHNLNLAEAVLQEASIKADTDIKGRVLFMGQIRQKGFYFSPVNFYLIFPEDSSSPRYLFAEVTNTPWKERHCYVVDLNGPMAHHKQFHVSPFNPMDMKYKWTVRYDEQGVFIQIDCHREELEFLASLAVSFKETKRASVGWPGLKILSLIYFHAFLLFLKRSPFYSHPKTKEAS
ncbi:MAG: DUF1365 domain-containing protein [Bdellovibrionales bacterium]|nr:DUF1365 domain-containing protein [Bdellovibrionales bacterium]